MTSMTYSSYMWESLFKLYIHYTHDCDIIKIRIVIFILCLDSSFLHRFPAWMARSPSAMCDHTCRHSTIVGREETQEKKRNVSGLWINGLVDSWSLSDQIWMNGTSWKHGTST